MDQFILETGTKTRFRDMEFISGWMEDVLKENGLIIACMDMDNILGQMGEDLLEDIFKIKKRVKESTFGFYFKLILILG